MNPASLLQQAGRSLQSRFLAQAGALSKPAQPHLLGRLLLLDHLATLRNAAIADHSAPSFYDASLAQLRFSWSAPEEQIARIPRTGPLIVVANHPYGLADGLILGSLMTRVRSDFKFLANSILAETAPVGSVICINPFEEDAAVAQNARALRSALRWLKSGGALVIFPAGEVAALDLSAHSIREPAWKDTAARLALRANAPVIPVRLAGSNSVTFHLAGLVSPRLRTVLLPRELVNKQGKTIELRVGKPIPSSRLASGSDPAKATRHLEWRTGMLAARKTSRPILFLVPQKQEAIAAAGDPAEVRREVESLPASALLIERSDLAVYCARAHQMPNTLREIGRLRELAFRAIGEGTGRPLDVDRYDQHYQHLFLWNRQTKEVIGAYRVASTEEARTHAGDEGLYTTSLFKIPGAFFAQLGPALELGRSFVRPEYQKDFAPLLLLWKGIGAVISRTPAIKSLFGAVSISNEYCPESRSLISSYLRQHQWHPELSKLVAARCPWNKTLVPPSPTESLDHLSDAIQEIEPDGKGVPVLLRQYLNLNGKAIALNVDRAFSSVVDALVVVEIAGIPRRAAQRYLVPSQVL